MGEISVELPDGSVRKLPENGNALDLARSISKSLAKEVVVAKVDGKLTDLQDPLPAKSKVELFKANTPEGEDVLRHSCEHILASAVCKLFSGAQVTMGPKSHEKHFYYDFDIGRAFTPEDLTSIEKEMSKAIAAKTSFEKKIVTKKEALALFKKLDQRYKPEILDWIPDENVSIYQNDSFIDLCRGPHLPHAGFIKAFKLLSVSGSYWRADATREMLQRITGIAFASKKELDAHLHQLEEAKKRDHRKLGSMLDLFTVSDPLIGPGLVLWLPKGTRLKGIIEEFSKRMHYENGYEMVTSPHIARSDLWKTSGHLEFYRESMFPALKMDDHEYVLKPMNCPFHVIAYKNKLRSYRDLPLRFAEFGTVYRYELAGAMHGLMRARGFTQDDAHIFCRMDQLSAEIDQVIGFVLTILKAFGFKNFEAALSTRPDKFVGETKGWDKAESALLAGLKRHKLSYHVDEGGGAFYGPKIDLHLRDSLNRLWQCSTIQLDFNNPLRFDMSFINDKGEQEQPIMIHRALLGSFERFIGILIEEFSGAFPMWLAPEQIRILTIADRHLPYAQELKKVLEEEGFRVCVPEGSDKLGAKIREAQMQKIPVMLVVGDEEVKNKAATIRERNGTNAGSKTQAEIISYCKVEAKIPIAS